MPGSSPSAAVPLRVVAVGSPMLDTMACVGQPFLQEHGLPPGDATPVPDTLAFARLKGEAMAASSRPPAEGLGGCAGNTAKVLACLGCAAGFCGGVGRDPAAEALRRALAAHGLGDLLAASADGEPEGAGETGQVLCLITPGGERTFAYRSGASAALRPAQLREALGAWLAAGGGTGLALAYFDVYTFLCPGALPEDGMREARALGAQCGLNLGSPGAVEAHRGRLWRLLEGGLCDVVMMNEAEARALDPGAGGAGVPWSPEEACRAASALCELAVVTLGSGGVWVARGRGAEPRLHPVQPAEPAKVVDSTGAGDFFAGGFLGAWLRGLPEEECVRWGSAAAVAVLSAFGTDLGRAGWEALRAECMAT